jgi:hypothetical protein
MNAKRVFFVRQCNLLQGTLINGVRFNPTKHWSFIQQRWGIADQVEKSICSSMSQGLHILTSLDNRVQLEPAVIVDESICDQELRHPRTAENIVSYAQKQLLHLRPDTAETAEAATASAPEFFGPTHSGHELSLSIDEVTPSMLVDAGLPAGEGAECVVFEPDASILRCERNVVPAAIAILPLAAAAPDVALVAYNGFAVLSNQARRHNTPWHPAVLDAYAEGCGNFQEQGRAPKTNAVKVACALMGEPLTSTFPGMANISYPRSCGPLCAMETPDDVYDLFVRMRGCLDIALRRHLKERKMIHVGKANLGIVMLGDREGTTFGRISEAKGPFGRNTALQEIHTLKFESGALEAPWSGTSLSLVRSAFEAPAIDSKLPAFFSTVEVGRLESCSAEVFLHPYALDSGVVMSLVTLKRKRQEVDYCFVVDSLIESFRDFPLVQRRWGGQGPRMDDGFGNAPEEYVQAGGDHSCHV